MGGAPITEERNNGGAVSSFQSDQGGSDEVVGKSASSPTTTVPFPDANDASIPAPEENTKQTNVGASELSNEVNASSQNATSTSAISAKQVEIANVPHQVITMIYHAPKSINTDTSEVKLPGWCF